MSCENASKLAELTAALKKLILYRQHYGDSQPDLCFPLILTTLPPVHYFLPDIENWK